MRLHPSTKQRVFKNNTEDALVYQDSISRQLPALAIARSPFSIHEFLYNSKIDKATLTVHVQGTCTDQIFYLKI